MSCNYLLNQTFMPQFLKGHEAEAFANYLKTFCDLGIHHIQFSIVDRKTLLDTQKHPEKYPDLLVRVRGYSAYFVDLNKGMKRESKICKILSEGREEMQRRLENEKNEKVRIRWILLSLVASGLAVEDAAALVGMKQRIAYVWIN